ncbi:protein of unknown function DUF218 [Deinococcus proteolyticus MRP]|uniref:DUF218 domain-containing protein n=1 Tax=Deinococcus proteolyticus (strain ATCC 35074 / DSM 20540 / JCM 6276 / NBRC 101906 / NCIMB 13154 / VKM Ac-1939 / CCM 2703 / MRP) TaxID=693977 RepID=F0RMD5_DEIPM|nr:YdcF family protein [Deinococcus proteolyticus]ADY27072.1 protein of unknown function DUF218 [Deinococcus proteolyticus MRP]
MFGRTLRNLALLALALAAFFLWPLGVPREKPHPTLVVLGAAQYAGRPSPAFQVRLDHALELYRAGGVHTIVVTGGRQAGDPYTEGGVGVSYLQRRGVPAEVLKAEERSRTTAQNLNYAAELLPPHAAVTVVTDRAHAPRALAMARDIGFNANASPSPLWPHASLRYRLRERLAWAAYMLLDYEGLRTEEFGTQEPGVQDSGDQEPTRGAAQG